MAKIKGKLKEGVKAIDECSLPGKLKLWCLQFGFDAKTHVAIDSL